MTDIFMKVLINEKVKLEPRYLNRNYKNELIKRLNEKLAGKCTRHGYIKKDSIEIYKITPGMIEMISLNGTVNYDIYFHAEVCNPMLGTMLNVKVINTNKFGILAESGYTDSETNEFLNIIEIIIAKNSVSIVSDTDLDNISKGDELKVEVIGKKYELNDKQIKIFGKIVVDPKKKTIIKNDQVDLDDDADEDADFIDDVELDVEDAEDADDADADDADPDDADADDLEDDDAVDDLEDDDDVDEDDDKKGGNLFSDDEFFGDDDYDIYDDKSDNGSGGGGDDDDD
jgi:DNA-directed RNA polymerase subunit E'/Rpb7